MSGHMHLTLGIYDLKGTNIIPSMLLVFSLSCPSYDGNIFSIFAITFHAFV